MRTFIEKNTTSLIKDLDNEVLSYYYSRVKTIERVEDAYKELLLSVCQYADKPILKAEFKREWDRICLENHFDKEELKPKADHFFVKDIHNRNIGTMELNMFELTDDKAKYFNLINLKDLPNRLLEVDKVGIKKGYNSIGNLNRLLAGLCIYVRMKNIQYGVALLEPKFYRVLEAFKFASQIGDRVFYKGDDVIPSLITTVRNRKFNDFLIKKILKEAKKHNKGLL